MILEKNYLKKILIAVLGLTFVLFLAVSPVYASHSVSDERVEINLITNKGSEKVSFYNTEMVHHEDEIFHVTFDADLTIDIATEDQVVIEKNFLENYVLIQAYNNIFTGFVFDFVYSDGSFEDKIHTGRVNMINNGDLNNTNMLDGFSDQYHYYKVFVRGNSFLSDDPETSVVRDLLFYEGIKPFPFASSFDSMGDANYGSSNKRYNYILGEDGEYLNFQPTEVVVRFEGILFEFDPYQAGMSVGNGLHAVTGNATGVQAHPNQTLTNFNYDHDVKVEAMTPALPGSPSVPRTDFRIDTYLRFEDGDPAGGGPGYPGDPGTEGIFSIIPAIMIAIFSFFWMIGSVELGGIPGLTLVGITSFFVGFMIIKIIIGLFKGGGD